MMAARGGPAQMFANSIGRLGSRGHFHLSNVRFWHKADIRTVLIDVRFWG
jgi:hypothetical protein